MSVRIIHSMNRSTGRPPGGGGRRPPHTHHHVPLLFSSSFDRPAAPAGRPTRPSASPRRPAARLTPAPESAYSSLRGLLTRAHRPSCAPWPRCWRLLGWATECCSSSLLAFAPAPGLMRWRGALSWIGSGPIGCGSAPLCKDSMGTWDVSRDWRDSGRWLDEQRWWAGNIARPRRRHQHSRVRVCLVGWRRFLDIYRPHTTVAGRRPASLPLWGGGVWMILFFFLF